MRNEKKGKEEEERDTRERRDGGKLRESNNRKKIG